MTRVGIGGNVKNFERQEKPSDCSDDKVNYMTLSKKKRILVLSRRTHFQVHKHQLQAQNHIHTHIQYILEYSCYQHPIEQINNIFGRIIYVIYWQNLYYFIQTMEWGLCIIWKPPLLTFKVFPRIPRPFIPHRSTTALCCESVAAPYYAFILRPFKESKVSTIFHGREWVIISCDLSLPDYCCMLPKKWRKIKRK